MANKYFQEWVQGVLDAASLRAIIGSDMQAKKIRSSRRINSGCLEIAIFNGAACLIPWAVNEFLLVPLVARLQEEEFGFPFNIVQFFVGRLPLLFILLWYVPLTILMLVLLNNKWLGMVVEALTSGKPAQKSFDAWLNVQKLMHHVAKKIEEATFNHFFLLHSVLFPLIIAIILSPLGWSSVTYGALNWALNCWLYALYCFELIWKNSQLNQRLNFLEYHLPYFFGFGMVAGLPCTVAGLYLPAGLFVSNAVWFLLFPFFMINARLGKYHNLDKTKKVKQLRFTWPVKYANVFFLNYLSSLLKGKKYSADLTPRGTQSEIDKSQDLTQESDTSKIFEQSQRHSQPLDHEENEQDSNTPRNASFGVEDLQEEISTIDSEVFSKIEE